MVARKPLRPCSYPGCSNLTRNRYCEDHQKEAEKKDRERHKFYDRYKRDRKAAAFYKSKPWGRVRQQAMIRDKGLCQHCLKEKKIQHAGEVDHIIPIKFDWALRLRLDNLQALCHRCHSIKTAEDKRKYGG